MLGARIAQRRQVHPRKERLTTAEQDRRDRDVHFVDVARLEILAHRGRPAADLDIAPARPARGLPGATKRFVNSAGDEMKDGPAFHRDRFARVVRQHEHRHVIRRVLAPPAAPLVVGPRPAYGAEHVSAHDIRTDAFPEALGKIVVGTRRPARFAVYLAKRARADVPAVQLLTTHAQAPRSRITTPMATTRAPSPSKARTTPSGVAPSTRRTPISRRRCATMSASTPYKPRQASISARRAKVAISVMLKRPRASESP